MLKVFRKGRKKSPLLMGLLMSAALLGALVFGYDLSLDDLAEYFWPLLGTVAFLIVLALLPASLLVWWRHKRRHADPFDLGSRDRHR